MSRLALAAAGLALVLAVSVGAAAPRRDFAATALNVLPPGQNGSVAFDAHSTDQAAMYDGLTPLFDKVTPADLAKWYKPEPLGLGKEKAVRTYSPRPGVTIRRDRFGVPHVEGKTLQDVEFGAGWATAEDRGILLELIRGPARLSAVDVPGLSPLSVALSGRQFVPSQESEAFLGQQIALLQKTKLGRTIVTGIDAYIAGINAQYRSTHNPVPPWTRNDVVAVTTLIGARFGAGGGDEARRSMFLDALRKQLGAKAQSVFDDLRESDDPEAPVSIRGVFHQEAVPATAPGSVVLDDGSFTAGSASPLTEHLGASNALLVAAGRSATGHPLMVAGPQVGYFYPEFFMEVDLHGGGFDARGALFPGDPLVVLGRGKDFAWSATSSQADNTDLVAETLCGGDDAHYLYKGECRAMGVFSAGSLKVVGQPDQPIAFKTTVHGPVQGYATVGGKKVAIAFERSTRGRELLSAAPFYKLNTNQVRSAGDFLKTVAGVEFSFNWFYVDSRDIALFSSGRLPVRANGTDPGLPRIGDGRYEWNGFLTPAQHAQWIAPRKTGAILNWNNKPAAGVGAADDNWSYGSIHRVDLLTDAVGTGKHTLASLTAAMNKAATQDLRAVRVLPTIDAVLRTGAAPSARAERMLGLLEAWRSAGASRLDRDLDGKVDDPGAAILDAAWPRLAKAVMSPVLGPALVDRLASLHDISDDANPGGSSYIDGWYGYVDKDLRSLLGKPVAGRFANRYCGAGDLAACRASLWAALDEAGAVLEAKQGADPSAWRADATAERIRFAPGILPTTMRWANRPTFQQVISFAAHR